jgi:hypothetical protein
MTPTEFEIKVANVGVFNLSLSLSETDKHHLGVIFAKPKPDGYSDVFMAFKYLSYKRYTDLDYDFDRIPLNDVNTPGVVSPFSKQCRFTDYSDDLKTILQQLSTTDVIFTRDDNGLNIKTGYEEDFKKIVHKRISAKTVGSSLSERRVNFFPIDYPKTLGPEIVSYAFVGELNKKNKMMVDSINSSLSNLAPQKSLLSYPIDAAKQGYKHFTARRQASSMARKAINKEKVESSYPFAKFLGYKKGDAGFITNWGGTRKRQLQARRE